MYPSSVAEMYEVIETVCTGCPTRNPCLTYALIANETEGIWGATIVQRRKMLHSLMKSKRNWYEDDDFINQFVESFIKDPSTFPLPAKKRKYTTNAHKTVERLKTKTQST